MEENTALDEGFRDVSMLSTCEQCGCCSSACPLTGVDDFNVRRIVRHIELGLVDEIAETPLPWACTTCGRCEGVCPNGVGILDIIRPLRSMSPREFVPDTPPCIKACPAGVDIPSYLRLIAQGRPDEAYALILEKVPFPGILGRVCTHPCEDMCRRGEVNRSISICALKRYAADKAGDFPVKALEVTGDTGRKAAVIGAGPAGLTAAFYLRKKGHQVTVLEEKSKPGGMMRYGIPYYRLPDDVLEKEIDLVLRTGIELRTDQKLGRDFDIKRLKEEGFEAIFLATGLPLSRKIELEGSGADEVFWGVEFLADVSEGKDINLKDRVLIIGGGNVAIDVALTALRVGAREVTLACLESIEEMPANPWEVETAFEEGVKVMPCWGPKRIIRDDGGISSVELIRCTSVFDEEGNFCPTFEDAIERVEVDQVILAIGQTGDFSFLHGEESLKVEKGLIIADRETQETGMEGVFAGGDVVKGPGIVIEAISAGRRAAKAIDLFLGGDGVIDKDLAERADTLSYTGKREKGFAELQRIESPSLPISERHDGFREVDLCFQDDQAVQEANRCLQCDLEIALGQISDLKETP